jgi:hypothetical protein
MWTWIIEAQHYSICGKYPSNLIVYIHSRYKFILLPKIPCTAGLVFFNIPSGASFHLRSMMSWNGPNIAAPGTTREDSGLSFVAGVISSLVNRNFVSIELNYLWYVMLWLWKNVILCVWMRRSQVRENVACESKDSGGKEFDTVLTSNPIETTDLCLGTSIGTDHRELCKILISLLIRARTGCCDINHRI